MCRQSSIPTSIFIELFISGYCANVWTIISTSFTKSDNLLTTVTRKKYLSNNIYIYIDKYIHEYTSNRYIFFEDENR